MPRLVRRSYPESRRLTVAQKRRLARLAALSDSKIDYSDIPPLPSSFRQRAVRNPFIRSGPQTVSVRLDADVANWLRQYGGKNYRRRLQRLVNQMLRHAMQSD